MHSVTSILLVTKARHAAAEATAAAVSQWLEAHGVACSALPADCPSEKLVGRARTSDAILILGGDGTFVGVGRKLAGLNIPLLGINFGQVGFLTELSAVGWEPALERLLAGKMITRTCLLLAWELLRGGTPIASGHAANDVVVGRGAIARVLPVHVFVDGEDMGVVRSDGVIVSRTLKLFGIGESSMEEQLRDEMNAMTNPTLAPYAKEGECELRVTAKAPTMEQAQGAYTHEEKWVLVTVLTRGQAQKLRLFVHSLDEHAFITIVNSSEIVGKGFRSI